MSFVCAWWLQAAVKVAAFVFMHMAYETIQGLRESENERVGEKSIRNRKRERIKDDESLTKERRVNLET